MSVSLGIFGRAPLAGQTKTRLIPSLGAEGAASLYAAFLADLLDRVRALPGFETALWTADATPSPALDALLEGVPRVTQCEGDLGARMLDALTRGCEAEGSCLVIGSDAPTLPVSLLLQAAEALGDADVVLGPASDGGYTLIGTRRPAAAMFEGVRFSTRHALADTQAACRAAGLTVARVSTWYDVDTPRDLGLLRAHLALDPEAAPLTAAWLAEP